MRTYNTADDTELLASLTVSMERDGWVGAPLVEWTPEPGQLLTGSHRYTVWTRELGYADAPTVTVEDIFAEAGLDFDALYEAAGYPDLYADEHDIIDLLLQLPRETIDRYGIDYQQAI